MGKETPSPFLTCLVFTAGTVRTRHEGLVKHTLRRLLRLTDDITALQRPGIQ